LQNFLFTAKNYTNRKRDPLLIQPINQSVSQPIDQSITKQKNYKITLPTKLKSPVGVYVREKRDGSVKKKKGETQ